MNEDLAALLDSVDDCVARFDQHWRFTYVNAATKRMLRGLDRLQDPLIGMSHWDIFPDLKGTDLERAYQRAMKEQTPLEMETYYAPANAWFHVRAFPYGGGLTLLFQDITKRKTAEEALRQQREWFAVTLSSIGDAVIATDQTGAVAFLNPVAERMTGWKSSEALGRSVEEVFCIYNETTGLVAPNPVRRVIREGVTVGLANHTVLRSREGATYPIDDSAAPIRDQNGEIVGVVMVFHDVTERRRAEDAMRTSEEKFRATFFDAGVGMAVADEDGRFEMVNERFAEMLGYLPEKLIGLTVAQVSHPEEHARTRENMARLRQGLIARYSYEKRFVRIDGEVIWGRTSVALLPPGPDGGRRFVGVVEDVTARRLAEARVAETAERLQLALSAGHLGVWTWDAATDAVDLSDDACRIFSLPRGTMTKWVELRGLLDPDYRERARIAVERAVATHSDYSIEYRVVPEGAPPRWVMARGRPSYRADGGISGMTGVVQDITERKLAEETSARLAAIVNSSDAAIISMTLDGVITTWNQAAERMFQYTASEMVGASITAIVPPERGTEEPMILERLSRGERMDDFRTERLRKDGTRIDVSLSISPIFDAAGKIVGVSKISRDITAQKRSEEVQARLAAVVASSDDAILSMTLEGIITTWNRSAERLFGYTAQEMLGTSIERLLPPDRATEEPHILEQLRRGQRIEHFETVRQRKDGSLITVSLSVSPILDVSGNMVGISKILRDISEQKKAEETQARLAAVVSSSSDGIISLTLNGEVTTWNRGAEELYGYSAEEMIGRPIQILAPPDRQDEIPQILGRVKTGERIEQFETKRMAKDGTAIDVSLSVSPIFNPSGLIVGVAIIYRDISGLKQAEKVLREEAQLLELLNASGQAIASNLDLEALMQAVTDAATKLCGAQFGAFFHNSIGDQGEELALYTLSGAPKAAFEKFGHPRATALFGPTFRGEGVIRCADVLQDPRYGTMAPHHGMPRGHLPVRSYLAVPVRSRNGEVLGGLFFGHSEPGVFTERSERLVAGVASQAGAGIDNSVLFASVQRELRERKKAESALAVAKDQTERASRAKDEFIAALSHELRTPLTPVLFILSEALKSGDLSAELAEDLRTALRNVTLEARLIDDLLDLTRITEGKLRLKRDRTTLGEVIQAALDTCFVELEAKGLKLEQRLHSPAQPLFVDPARVAQIIWNLVKNAIKFTPPDGVITVRSSLKERHGATRVEIAVSDTGIGIAEADLPKIFLAFEQGSTASVRQFGGLGLGLAISRALATAHEGSLEAESAGRNQGSTFTLCLPLDNASAAQPAPSDTRPHPREVSKAPAKLRILLVEDHADTASTLSRLLTRDGHVVKICKTVKEAAAFFEANPSEVDLLLSDLGLPDGTGLDLLSRMRRTRDLPAIALSGFGMESDVEASKAAGFTWHLTKPVDVDELRNTIAQVSER